MRTFGLLTWKFELFPILLCLLFISFLPYLLTQPKRWSGNDANNNYKLNIHSVAKIVEAQRSNLRVLAGETQNGSMFFTPPNGKLLVFLCIFIAVVLKCLLNASLAGPKVMYLRFRVISCPKVVNCVVILLMWDAITPTHSTKKQNRFEIKASWKYSTIEWKTSNSNGLAHWANINAHNNSIQYYIEIDNLISMAIGNESWFIWFFQLTAAQIAHLMSTSQSFPAVLRLYATGDKSEWHKFITWPPFQCHPLYLQSFFFLDAYNSILLRLFGWLSFFFKNIFSFLSFVFINMYSHGCWNYGKVNVIFARYREKWSRAMECEAKRSHHHQLSCCCRHRRAHRCYKNFCQSWSKMRFFFRSYFWLCRVECVCVVFSGPLGTMKNHGVGW